MSCFLYLEKITENVELPLTIDSDIEQRNGKDYLTVKHVDLELKFSNLAKDFVCINIRPNEFRVMKNAWNTHSKLLISKLLPDFEKYSGEIISTILTPIFEKIAIQDFFQDFDVIVNTLV